MGGNGNINNNDNDNEYHPPSHLNSPSSNIPSYLPPLAPPPPPPLFPARFTVQCHRTENIQRKDNTTLGKRTLLHPYLSMNLSYCFTSSIYRNNTTNTTKNQEKIYVEK